MSELQDFPLRGLSPPHNPFWQTAWPSVLPSTRQAKPLLFAPVIRGTCHLCHTIPGGPSPGPLPHPKHPLNYWDSLLQTAPGSLLPAPDPRALGVGGTWGPERRGFSGHHMQRGGTETGHPPRRPLTCPGKASLRPQA